MCEQTEVQYLEGDIVWVKLGKCWWPGEVKDFDKIDDAIKNALRKRPIAVVKFFQEDTFEYVKNLDNIYKYNCRKKHEFIKKGLDKYRKETNDFMNKFPGDIIKAEELTNGDPDILESEEFLPEKKLNYNDIFGTCSSPKKTPKDLKGKGRPRKVTKSADLDRKIFHRSYVRKSDYGVTYLEQNTPPANTSKYTCHICGYTATRLNVIVLHNKCHIRGYFTPNSGKKTQKKRANVSKKTTKFKFVNTSNFDEDLQLIRQGYMLSDGSEDSEEEVEEAKKTINKRSKVQKTKTPPKKPKTGPSMACSDLLAEWSDNEAEEPKDSEESPKSPKSRKSPKITAEKEKPSESISNALLAEWDTNSDNENDTKNEEPKESSKTAENGKDCFDFKEEEFTVLQKSPGRKIPRVILHNRKSTEPILDEKDDKTTNDDTKATENKADAKETSPEVDQQAFESLLEETAVPNLPALDTLKSAQNFQLVKPQKSPDKPDDNLEKTNGVFKKTHRDTPSECPIPKKRFARNFEDFTLEKESTQPPETSLQSAEDKSNLEVSKLKTQLMTKLQESPEEKKAPRGRSRRGQKSEEIEEKLAEVTQNDSTEAQIQITPIEIDQNKEEVTDKSLEGSQVVQKDVGKIDKVQKDVEKIQEEEQKESHYRKGKRGQKSKPLEDNQEAVDSTVEEKVQQGSQSRSRRGRRDHKDQEVPKPEETDQEILKNDDTIPEKPVRKGRYTQKDKEPELQRNLDEIPETSSSKRGRKTLLEKNLIESNSPILDLVIDSSPSRRSRHQKDLLEEKSPILEDVTLPKSPIPEMEISKKGRQSQKGKAPAENLQEGIKSTSPEETALEPMKSQRGKASKESLEEERLTFQEETPTSPLPQTSTEVSPKKGRQGKAKNLIEPSLEEEKTPIPEEVELPKSPLPQTAEVAPRKGHQSQKGKSVEQVLEEKSTIPEEVELIKSPIEETMTESPTKSERQGLKEVLVEETKSLIPEVPRSGRHQKEALETLKSPIREENLDLPSRRGKKAILDEVQGSPARGGRRGRKSRFQQETSVLEELPPVEEVLQETNQPKEVPMEEVSTSKNLEEPKESQAAHDLPELPKSPIHEGLKRSPIPEGLKSPTSSRRGRYGQKETQDILTSPIREEISEIPLQSEQKESEPAPTVEKFPETSSRKGRQSRRHQKEIPSEVFLEEQQAQTIQEGLKSPIPEERNLPETSTRKGRRTSKESALQEEVQGQLDIPEGLKSPISHERIPPETYTRKGRRARKELEVLQKEQQEKTEALEDLKSPTTEETSNLQEEHTHEDLGVSHEESSQTEILVDVKSPLPEEENLQGTFTRKGRRAHKESEALQEENQTQTVVHEGFKSPIHEEKTLPETSTRKGRRGHKEPEILQENQTEIPVLKSPISEKIETIGRKERHANKEPEVLQEEQAPTEVPEGLKSPISKERNLPEKSTRKGRRAYKEPEVFPEEVLKSQNRESRKGKRTHKEKEIEPPSPMYEEIEQSPTQKEIQSLHPLVQDIPTEIQLPKSPKLEEKLKSPIPEEKHEIITKRRLSHKDIEGLKSPIREENQEISSRRPRLQRDKEITVQIPESPARVGRRGRKGSRAQDAQIVEQCPILEETSTLKETIVQEVPQVAEEQVLPLHETITLQEELPQMVPPVVETEEKSYSKGRRCRKEKQVTKQDPDTIEDKLPEIPEEKVLKEVIKAPPKTIPQRGNRRRSKRFSQDEIEKDFKIEDVELRKEVVTTEETSLEKIVLNDSAKDVTLPPEEMVQEETIITENTEITTDVPQVAEQILKPSEEKQEMEPQLEETVHEEVIVEQSHVESSDNLSGLATLATVSEMSGFAVDQKEIPQIQNEEEISQVVQEEKKAYSSPKKGATLATFSMDYSDSNEGLPQQIIEEEVPQHVEEVLPIEETVIPMEEVQPNFPVQEETVISESVSDSFLGETHSVSEKVVDNTREIRPVQSSPSKLLEILTEPKSKKVVTPIQKHVIQNKPSLVNLTKTNQNKFVIKSSRTPSKSTSKPIILSEKIIKSVTDTETVSVRKVTSKRTYQDVEDIDTFIIEKPTKKPNVAEDIGDIILTPKTEVKHIKGRTSGARGKPKIIEQTIIKAADVPTETGPVLDDAMFDINSMPIVLSDQILTPETIENMPVITDIPGQGTSSQTPPDSTVLKRGGMLQQVKLLKKPGVIGESPKTPQTVIKGIMPKGLAKNQKVYASSTKLLKTNPAVITQPGKPGKFIILPTSSPSTSSGSKYTVGKRIAMKTPEGTPKSKSLQGLSPEPSGNKIMIITNNQGEQSRVLLTPAQQKMLAGKMPTTKITKTTQLAKGNLVQKSILTSKGTLLPVTQSQKTIVTQAIMTSKGQIIPTQGHTLVTSEGQVLTPLTPQQLKSMKSADPKKRLQQRILLPEKPLESTKSKIIQGKKTILLKSTPGQTYKKIVESPKQVLTSLDPGVSKQIPTKTQMIINKTQIAQSSQEKVTKFAKQTEKTISKVKTPAKPMAKGKIINPPQKVPPLAPITKKDTVEVPKKEEQVPAEQKHLIIQDNMGNQTTVTEGQILALPRETVDGRPQSYMLVTVDESGNLVPLSNEALMSLDPNLAQGGDLNNLVLQFDPNQQAQTTQETNQTESKTELPQTETVPEGHEQTVVLDQTAPVQEQVVLEQPVEDFEEQIVTTETSEVPQEVPQKLEQQTLACNISTGETSQQLIITGDPKSTQKFLASLSEGNTDLSSLLTGGEGNIIINADGQQILLNTGDPENQILLMPSTSEGQIYESQIKNQDILAAALADTDVFQGENQEKSVDPEKSSASQLSLNSAMYPVSIGNVLETSLTLGSPIMTPLEVPSNKVKHDLESTIMTQVPSSLELPITITDPSITQTVSQQVMLSSELVQSNMKLPISVSESIQITEMSSPNFVYFLPSLEEAESKTMVSESTTTSLSVYSSLGSSMSMPLLTEEPDVAQNTPEESTELSAELPSELPEKLEDSKQEPTSFQDSSVVEMTKKLTTITNTLEMSPIEDDLGQNNDFCDSLSEPPPGMFEKSSFLNDSYLNKPNETEEIQLPEHPKPEEEMERTSSPFVDENSCEIPIQPQIITSLDKIDDETQPNLIETKKDD